MPKRTQSEWLTLFAEHRSSGLSAAENNCVPNISACVAANSRLRTLRLHLTLSPLFKPFPPLQLKPQVTKLLSCADDGVS